jgi:hypothetical protein
MREGNQIISLGLGAAFYKIVNSVPRRHEEKCLTIDVAAPCGIEFKLNSFFGGVLITIIARQLYYWIMRT